MRILVVTYQYLLPDSVAARRPIAMARYLPRHGIDVSILTYSPGGALQFEGNVAGVRDLTRETVPFPVYAAWRLWQKAARLAGTHRGEVEYWRDATIRQMEAIVQWARPDAILASYPPAEALEVGNAIADRFGIPLVADFRDGMLFDPVEEAALSSPARRRHYETLERGVVSRSRLVLTVSEPLSQYFRTRYDHPNVRTLSNGYDPADTPIDMAAHLPAGVINVVHTGRLGTSRMDRSGETPGLESLCRAFGTLLAREATLPGRLRVHFVGALTAGERRCLRPYVDAGLVTLWGHRPRAEALGFQRAADVLLLITAADQPSIATGKLFEYLAAARPILALTRGTEAARIIRTTGSGTVVDPGDPSSIERALTAIVHGNDPAVTRDERAIALFSRDTQMARLGELLMAL